MKKHGVIYGLLVLGLLFAMFRFSGQNTEVSNGLSCQVAEQILAVFYPGYSSEELNAFNLVIRKVAHFTLFSLLGIGLTGLLRSFHVKYVLTIALVLGAMAAILDESHQYFVQGRNASFYDVLLDSCGVLSGGLVYQFIAGLWSRRKKVKGSEKMHE